jgi:hypothetical protein
VYLQDVRRLSSEQIIKNIPGLDDAEVHDANLKSEEDAVADVVLPSQSIERDTIHKLIEEQRRSNAEVQPYETLGTKPIGQDFRGIGCHDTRLDVVEDAVEEDGDDEAFSETFLWGNLISSGDDREDVEYDESADGGDEIDWATSELVDEKGEEEVLT